MSPEDEAACAGIEAALRECYGVAQTTEGAKAIRWPRQGSAWLEFLTSVERYANLANDSGECPEQMVTRLKEILENTLPQGEFTPQLRDVVVRFSIEAYSKATH